jgi:hypothetical protein
MLTKTLRFVQGAISTSRAGLPDMEHYRIEDNRITAFNGRMALSAPFGLAIKAYPKAADFYKAVRACEGAEEVKVKLTEGGKLGIATDTFRAYVSSLPDVEYYPQPEGALSPCPETLLDDLKLVAPFVGEDASRPWGTGVLFDHGCLTATNNVVILRVWNDHGMPTINLPGFAVNELLRIGELPTMIQTDGISCITFHYLDGSWLKAFLLATEWPRELMDRIFAEPAEFQYLPEDMAAAVETMAAFVDGPSSPIYFEDGYITNSPHKQDGALVAVPGLAAGPCFAFRALRLSLGIAEAWDLSLWPDKPCAFMAKDGKARGALLGRVR